MIKPADVFPRLRNAAGGTAMMSLVDQLFVSGTRFATTVMVGRFGSEAELGVYSLAFSVLILLVSCQESLISIPYTVFVKQLSSTDQRKYSASSLVHSLCLNAIAMVVLAVGCCVLFLAKGSGDTINLLGVLAVMLPFLLLREFARRFAFAHLRVHVALALDVVVSILQLGGLGALAWGGQLTATSAYFVSGVAAAGGAVTWLILTRSNFQLDRKCVVDDWKRNQKFGKWVAGSHLISVLHMYFVHWLLAATIDERATGVFAACMTVVVLANPFILGMSNILSPKAAHAFAAGGTAAAGQIVWRFGSVITLILTVFALVIGVSGNWLIVMVFDEKYAGNGASILVLALGTIALGASFAAASGLRAINRPAVNFWAALAGLLVTVVVSSLLVIPAGIFGTAIGLVAGFYAMAGYRILAFRAAI